MDIDSVKINSGAIADPVSGMEKIFGVILTVMRFIGIGMVIWGIYSIVMSVTQERPEEKVKGIALALSGVVMIGLKSLLQAVGVFGA